MAELTNAQRDVLGFVQKSIDTQGWPPTLEEICGRFGWASSHSALCHLRALETKGAIIRNKGRARAIRVTAAGRKELR